MDMQLVVFSLSFYPFSLDTLIPDIIYVLSMHVSLTLSLSLVQLAARAASEREGVEYGELEKYDSILSVPRLRAWVLRYAFPLVVSFSEAHMDLMVRES